MLDSLHQTDPYQKGCEVSLRLCAALIAGIFLGTDRWLHHKSAGIRTHSIVALGAATAILITQYEAPSGNKVYVLTAVVTAIGFLGSGVILPNPKSSRIDGLTTAASIWM